MICSKDLDGFVSARSLRLVLLLLQPRPVGEGVLVGGGVPVAQLRNAGRSRRAKFEYSPGGYRCTGSLYAREAAAAPLTR